MRLYLKQEMLHKTTTPAASHSPRTRTFRSSRTRRCSEPATHPGPGPSDPADTVRQPHRPGPGPGASDPADTVSQPHRPDPGPSDPAGPADTVSLGYLFMFGTVVMLLCSKSAQSIQRVSCTATFDSTQSLQRVLEVFSSHFYCTTVTFKA